MSIPSANSIRTILATSKKSHITLKICTGQKATRNEEMKCNVKFTGQEKKLILQVVETARPALFGPKFSWTAVKLKPLSIASCRKA